MWWWIGIAISHALVAFVSYKITRVIWYRRGLNDAWFDYTGVAFPR